MKATAIANANIALSKYWGKRDKKLMLPQNGSISMTLDELNTITTVEFNEKLKEDEITINGERQTEGKWIPEMIAFFDLVRERSGRKEKVKMFSETNFPIAAGLASSASGYAALAGAISKAAGLELNSQELSMLARRGSGSATRSVLGGFVEWKRGEKEDGSDSFAEQIAGKEHWKEFRMITTIVTKEKKKVSSRAGMSQSVATCPFYKGWLETVNEDLDKIRKGIKEKDFKIVGETAEFNCLKMHAIMLTTKPSIIYWNPATIEIIKSVLLWREEGIGCYFTIDAGPNVKVICLEKEEKEIKKRLEELNGVMEAIICKPGDGLRYSEKHLF